METRCGRNTNRVKPDGFNSRQRYQSAQAGPRQFLSMRRTATRFDKVAMGRKNIFVKQSNYAPLSRILTNQRQPSDHHTLPFGSAPQQRIGVLKNRTPQWRAGPANLNR